MEKTKTSEEQEKEISFLIPSQDIVKISGRLLYNEGIQAWSIIRLKNTVLNEFPQLRDKRGSFSYKMVIPRSFEAIKDLFGDLEEDNKKMPILLFFCKEGS